MRMKEPATRDGRILKCPMCREPEKVPGKRTAFSYEYELSKLYEPSPDKRARERALAPIVARNLEYDWELLADTIRDFSQETQERYIRSYPQLERYNQIQAASISMIQESVIQEVNEVYGRDEFLQDYHAFCQSGNRLAGTCPTRGKTERRCSFLGCNKFVCRRCHHCNTH